MYTHTMRTKFTFGDRVRFDSATQRRSGTGTIVAIVLGYDGSVDYMIGLDPDVYDEIQGGVLENEITLLADGRAS